MNNIKEQLLATDLAVWRKRALFVGIIVVSFFPFFILYQTSHPNLSKSLWELRHFVGIALVQAIAQISLAWYVLHNRVPNYVVVCLLIMVIFFQTTYGIAVILLSNA